MKPNEHPIIFSAKSVRAILAGQKTQTRRVVKLRATDGKCSRNCSGIDLSLAWPDRGIGGGGYLKIPCRDGATQRVDCPYGGVGDRLWVKEAWRNRSPIFMPRKFSRLTLLIVAVRCEQLQEITMADARAEGARPGTKYETFRSAYQRQWDAINSRRGYGWDTNPLVWVIEFRRANNVNQS